MPVQGKLQVGDKSMSCAFHAHTQVTTVSLRASVPLLTFLGLLSLSADLKTAPTCALSRGGGGGGTLLQLHVPYNSGAKGMFSEWREFSSMKRGEGFRKGDGGGGDLPSST